MSPTETGIYKNFLFEGNSLTFLSSGIEILEKVLSIVKLVNSDLTHYLVKLLKNINLLISNIISFFIFRVIKGFYSIIEPLFSIKNRLFSTIGYLMSMI